MIKKIEELEGMIAKTRSGKWVRFNRLSQVEDEFKRPLIYFNLNGEEELVELHKEWPFLKENGYFKMISKYNRRLQPSEPLIFQLDNGFRFRVFLDNYRLTIPFKFKSIDPRADWLEAKWSCRAGKLVHRLVNQFLSISFENNKPILNVGFGSCPINDT